MTFRLGMYGVTGSDPPDDRNLRRVGYSSGADWRESPDRDGGGGRS